MNEDNAYRRDLEEERRANDREQQQKEQERLAEEKEYAASQTNNNSSDPTAKRNMGPGGIQEPKGEDKGQLHNLKIQGNEVTGYGDTDHSDENASHGGPGFKAEGGEYASPPIRDDDQVADESILNLNK